MAGSIENNKTLENPYDLYGINLCCSIIIIFIDSFLKNEITLRYIYWAISVICLIFSFFSCDFCNDYDEVIDERKRTLGVAQGEVGWNLS